MEIDFNKVTRVALQINQHLHELDTNTGEAVAALVRILATATAISDDSQQMESDITQLYKLACMDARDGYNRCFSKDEN